MNVTSVGSKVTFTQSQDTQMRQVAREFEASFLAEMLKNAGLTGREGDFSGGAGEEAFSGLLTQEYANAMADAGGIGLAEWVYNALIEKEGV